jgi:drug/metabolite transporter (DMT)-like permease
MIVMQESRKDLLPSLGIAFSAALWGLFWIPVRAIEQTGVSVQWTGPVLFACVTLIFLPVALVRWRVMRRAGPGLILTGLLPGAAFAFYAVSFNMTDVVHALLLFYVSPIWSTFLGLIMLGERLNINRVAALILGLSGLAVVLGDGVSFPWPRQMGDWFALASGLCWSFASVRLFQGGATFIFEKTFAFIASAFLVGAVLAILPLGIDNALPDIDSLKQGWIWITAVALFLLPATWLTIWPPTVLSPARVGILFMTEAIVGIGSAALLTDEPFGLQEMTGTALIMSAALVEVLREPDSSNKPSESKK